MFDLSICQQCIVFDKKGDKVVHVTPASIYTFYTHKILAQIEPLDREYTTFKGKTITKKLSYYFENHLNNLNNCHTKGSNFHNCKYCRKLLCEEILVEKWFERIQRYEKRFPNFEFVFITQ
jgi:hypothetical protein